MKLRNFIPIILGLAMGVTASAQATMLQITANPNPKSVQRFVIANTYHAAATEWVLATRFHLATSGPCRPGETAPDGGCVRTVLRHSWGLPAIPGQGPIPPQGLLPFGAPAGSTTRDIAVIYADGVVAGDAETIAELLSVRQRMLDDLREVVPMLSAAAANPGTDYLKLAATFEARSNSFRSQAVSDYRALGNSGPVPATADRVCQPLASEMASDAKTLSARDLQARYAKMARFLQGWLDQLVQSSPALK